MAQGALCRTDRWEDAALGDPLADVAGCRLELLWAYGDVAMRAFTREYLERSGRDATDLPYWELHVATAAGASMGDWGLEPERVERIRTHTRGFAERAAAEILRLG